MDCARRRRTSRERFKHSSDAAPPRRQRYPRAASPVCLAVSATSSAYDCAEHLWPGGAAVEGRGEGENLEGRAGGLKMPCNVPTGDVAGKEPLPGLIHSPPTAQDLQQFWRQHHVQILLTFALVDTDDHALAIDVGGFQPQPFGDAQAGGVAGSENGVVLGVADAAEEVLNFFRAQPTGSFCGFLGAGMKPSNGQSLFRETL